MVRSFNSTPALYGRGRQIWGISGVGGINRFSRVVASITELGSYPGGQPEFPFVGNATMYILNVSPSDNGNVYIRTFIDWGNILPFRVSLIVDP
jgi:hypothetical protein